MDDTTILFVVVIIAAIIIAIRLASTTARDTRTGGSDQRKTSNRSDSSDDGSGHRRKGNPHGGAVDDEEPTLGIWLISHIKSSKVAASFGETILCRIGIHQGTWTTEGCSGCWHRRFCIYCGIPQQQERHNLPPKADGEYFQDGSCETRVACLHCGKTKSNGKKHEGQIYKRGKFFCTRCGKFLGVEWVYVDD